MERLTPLSNFDPVNISKLMGITERKEKQKAELKQLILDASVKLFSEQGYEGVSMRKIAESIEYSPTTVYLYFKDKNEILYELHEIGFRKLAECTRDLPEIKNPLLRLYKLGENYIKFGLENPEYYDLMFMLMDPMDFIEQTHDHCDWKAGDDAFSFLKVVLQECMDKKLIKPWDLDSMAMAVWGTVHGLVSLAIRKRFEKVCNTEIEVTTTIHKALNWLINTMDVTT